MLYLSVFPFIVTPSRFSDLLIASFFYQCDTSALIIFALWSLHI